MMFPVITKSFQQKPRREYRLTNYSTVVQFLSNVQEEKFRKKLKSGTVKITLIYLALLGIVSIAVLIASNP